MAAAWHQSAGRDLAPPGRGARGQARPPPPSRQGASGGGLGGGGDRATGFFRPPCARAHCLEREGAATPSEAAGGGGPVGGWRGVAASGMHARGHSAGGRPRSPAQRRLRCRARRACGVPLARWEGTRSAFLCAGCWGVAWYICPCPAPHAAPYRRPTQCSRPCPTLTVVIPPPIPLPSVARQPFHLLRRRPSFAPSLSSSLDTCASWRSWRVRPRCRASRSGSRCGRRSLCGQRAWPPPLLRRAARPSWAPLLPRRRPRPRYD